MYFACGSNEFRIISILYVIIDTGLGKRSKYTNVARVSSEEEARNREEEEEAGIMMARRTENEKKEKMGEI